MSGNKQSGSGAFSASVNGETNFGDAGRANGSSASGPDRSGDAERAVGASSETGKTRVSNETSAVSAGKGVPEEANSQGSQEEEASSSAAPQRLPELRAGATPGERFRDALRREQPLQIAGAVNAYAAMLAQASGFRALYLSGAGVANASFGLPDLGMTTLNDVTEDVRRIAGATSLPLLVDADTGFGSAFNIARTVRELIRAGAAGMHVEDQVAAKRCGHRPNKALVSPQEMADRIASAVDARHDASFVLMARTDALASEGMDGTVARALAYVEAGADMIFLEAATSLEAYRSFAAQVKVPVLANVTEFGRTPLFTAAELGSAGVAMALYPLSAFRAMNAAALRTYRAIRGDGTQAAVVGNMQTREELYGYLGYYEYERKLDALFASGNQAGRDEA